MNPTPGTVRTELEFWLWVSCITLAWARPDLLARNYVALLAEDQHAPMVARAKFASLSKGA